MENTRIVSLEASNVLRLTAVRITPDRNWVEIRGANAAGKSSVINTIAMVLGGKALCPDEAIHRGTERAQVKIELENLVITRTWKGESTSLKVANRDGAEYRSPQKLLSELWDRLTFDPLAFKNMDRQEQLRVALAVQGLTDRMATSVANEKAAMEGRTNVGRSVKSLEERVAGIDVPDGTPEEEVDVVAISTDLRAAETKIAAHVAEEQSLAELIRTIEGSAVAIREEEESLEQAESDLQQMIERAKDRMQGIRLAIQQNQGGIKAQQDVYNTRRAEFDRFEQPATSALELQMANANATNAAVSRLAERKKLKKDLEAANLVLDDANEAVNRIRLDREAMLVGIELPVKGLGYSADGVTLDDLPFDQASSAHQLRASVGMAMKMNPELRVLLIRDGSLLDDVQLAALHQQIDETDYQLWIERVGSDGNPAEVVIEDGHIRGSTDVACSACSKIIPRAEAEANQIGGEGPVFPVRCTDCYAATLQTMGDQAAADADRANADRANAAAQEEADFVEPDLADGPPVER